MVEENDPDLTPEVEPRIPDRTAMLAVSAIRDAVAELAAVQDSLRLAYGREQRIRVICERYWDSPAARRIVRILDERTPP